MKETIVPDVSLFALSTLGDIDVENRIVMASLTRSRTDIEDTQTPLAIKHHRQRASVSLATPAMSLAVMDSVERYQGGLASGILNSARQAGGVIGVAVLGALLGEPVTSSGAQASEYVAALALCTASGFAFAVSIDRSTDV